MDIVNTPRSGPIDHRLQDMNRLRQPAWVFDIDHGKVLWCNNSCLDIWQAETLHELKCRDMKSGMSASVAKRLGQYQVDFLRDDQAEFCEIWTVYPNGEPRTVEVVFTGMRLEDGRMAMFCEALKEQEIGAEALRSAEALLHTSVMITLYAASGEPLYRNPAARSGVRSAHVCLEDHFASQLTVQLLDDATGDEVNTVASVHTIDGPRWHDITARRCFDAVSGNYAWLISEVDVSKLKATEERAQFLAEHDTLTQLPNRNHVSIGFQQRINQLLATGMGGALIFVDLDHFKDVNDTLGHAAGDQLLVEVSNRLRGIMRKEGVVARLGGDEFLLLIGPIEDGCTPSGIATEIKKVVSQPITILGRELKVTPSIGISEFPANGQDINELMRHADLAMYHAKDSGRNDYAFFSQDLSDAMETRINLESELQLALEENQFVAYFQPRVDVATNTIIGAEALVRWVHPEKGLISPATFIPVCEACGLISVLGKAVFAQSICAQRDWARQGFDLNVSVNLSPLQFGEPRLVDDLIEMVKKFGGHADRIELEITESVLLGHDQSTIDKLHQLVDYGFRIAIDDFGTGYSNLAYLHKYPISCLKIDRSFIQIIETSRPILELIVSMAQLFKLVVVAEGVETTQQLNALKKLGCEEYQGFLFEKAVEFDTFSAILIDREMKLAA